ncbi:MAG: Ribosomal protein L11 methyltransferase [Chlamydiae bacterium]|nr:Ribosomal protein L11 methyltransferase [Chlamydiota bacterium]
MLEEIDWEQQWADHAPGFKDGLAHIPLPSGEEIVLLPGPGFGDYSHPTTRLVIELMEPYIPSHTVFDIGCGSGILSLAAAKMGANRLHCTDIDPDALIHTKKNILMSGDPSLFSFDKPKEKPIVLMNMITSEQQNAWKVHKLPFNLLITSGILATQKEEYLDFAIAQNWDLVKIREREGWLGCIFQESH